VLGPILKLFKLEMEITDIGSWVYMSDYMYVKCTDLSDVEMYMLSII